MAHKCDEVGTDMSCRRTYIQLTWSAVCVFSPSRMAERMTSLHESAVRMIAPFLVKMATLSLAPVEPLEVSNPLSEYMSSMSIQGAFGDWSSDVCSSDLKNFSRLFALRILFFLLCRQVLSYSIVTDSVRLE